jgi:hypothetical protein
VINTSACTRPSLSIEIEFREYTRRVRTRIPRSVKLFAVEAAVLVIFPTIATTATSLWKTRFAPSIPTLTTS